MAWGDGPLSRVPSAGDGRWQGTRPYHFTSHQGHPGTDRLPTRGGLGTPRRGGPHGGGRRTPRVVPGRLMAHPGISWVAPTSYLLAWRGLEQ